MRFLLTCGLFLGLATTAYAQSGSGSSTTSGTSTGSSSGTNESGGTNSMNGATTTSPNTTDTHTDSMGNNIYDSKGHRVKAKSRSGHTGSDSPANSESALPGTTNNSSTQGR